MISGLAIFMLGSCTEESPEPETFQEFPEEKNEEVPEGELTYDDVFSRYTEIKLPQNYSEVLSASNRFALGLFSDFMEDEGYRGGVISPFNMFVNLSMLANGDSGECRDEILDYLGVKSLKTLNSYNDFMLLTLPNLDKATRMKFASSIWHDPGLALSQDFMNSVSDIYGTEDMAISPKGYDGMDAINRWVSGNTGGIVNGFLSYPYDTDCASVAATWFAGLWDPNCVFPPEDTREMPFHNLDGSLGKVDMMYVERTIFGIYESDGMISVKQIIGGGNFAMRFIMPSEGVDFRQMVRTLTPEKFERLYSEPRIVELTLDLPKFEVETNRDMVPVLRKNGLERVFNEGFDGICEGKSFPFSNYRQGIKLKIDEEGVEAAAIDYETLYGAAWGPEKVHVTFDRPFIFLIQEESTGAILFMGAKTSF